MPIPFGLTGAVVTIEVAFTTDPFDTTPSWTDITDYVDAVAGVTIDRGRSDAEGSVSPGTCTFTLRNSDGRFTPGNAAGAYYPNVQPRKKVRVTVDYESATYRRFTGYIQTWGLGWPGGVEESSQVQVTATDLVGVLASTPLRHSHLETILATDPVAAYPLTDGSPPPDLQDIESVVHANSVAVDRRRAHAAHNESEYRQPRLRKLSRKAGGTLEFADRGGEFPSDRNLRTVRVKNGSDEDGNGRIPWSGLTGDIDLQGATTTLAYGGWIKWQSDTVGDEWICSLSAGGTVVLTLMWDESASTTVATLQSDPASYTLAFDQTDRLRDGRWHHVFLRWTPGAIDYITLYVDGTLRTTQRTMDETASIPATAQLVIGGAQFSDGDLAYAAPRVAWYSHWAVWVDDAADAVDPAVIFDDGRRDVRSSSRSSDRVSWLLDRVNFPSADRNIDVGSSDIPSSAVSRTSALDYLNSVAESEMGVFFADRSGNGVFHSRARRYGRSLGAQQLSNPTIETNTTGWAGNALGGDTMTLAQSSTQAHGGTYSLRCTFPTLSAGNSYAFTNLNGVTAGQTYVIRGWVYVPTGTCDIRPEVVFYAGAPNITVKDEWVPFEYRWTATLTSSSVYFGFRNAIGQSYSNGDVFYVDDVEAWEIVSPPAATLSWHHPDEQFVTDVDSVANVAEVSYRRDGGGTVRLSDRTSRIDYGYRSASLSTDVVDENAAHGLAELILAYRATPVPRLSGFTWDLLTWPTAADNQAVLGIDVGDRVSLTDLPSQAPDLSVDVWVEGMTETLAVSRWTVSLNTSPTVDVMPDGYWVLGTSTLDDENADSSCYLGY